jgi:hypothetical protein
MLNRLGNINFDLTSIQAGNGAADFSTAKLANYYRIVTDHRDGSAAKGHPIPIMIDETPRVTLINDMTRLKMRSKVLYPIYLAGGNYEMHFYDAYGQAGSLSIEDLSPMLEDMRRARQFVETLPFFDMKPCEDLLTSSSTNYCFGKPGFVYAFYMSEGGSLSVDLTNVFGTYGLQWFNPRTGERIIAGSTAGGVLRTFTAPDNRDWALRLTRSNPPSYDFALYLPQIQR